MQREANKSSGSNCIVWGEIWSELMRIKYYAKVKDKARK